MRRRMGWGDLVVAAGLGLTAVWGAGVAWTSTWPVPDSPVPDDASLRGGAGALLATAAVVVLGAWLVAIVRSPWWLLIGAAAGAALGAGALAMLRAAADAPPATDTGRGITHGVIVTLFWGMAWPAFAVTVLALTPALPRPRR